MARLDIDSALAAFSEPVVDGNLTIVLLWHNPSNRSN